MERLGVLSLKVLGGAAAAAGEVEGRRGGAGEGGAGVRGDKVFEL